MNVLIVNSLLAQLQALEKDLKMIKRHLLEEGHRAKLFVDSKMVSSQNTEENCLKDIFDNVPYDDQNKTLEDFILGLSIEKQVHVLDVILDSNILICKRTLK